MVEAERFRAQKRLQESEANKPRESGSEVPSSKMAQKSNRPMNREKGESEGSVQAVVDSHQKIKGVSTGVVNGKDLSSTIPKSLDEWDVTGLPGAELLSDNVSKIHSFGQIIAFRGKKLNFRINFFKRLFCSTLLFHTMQPFSTNLII